MPSSKRKNKKCCHIKDTPELKKSGPDHLYKYSTVQVLYETEKGRVVKCYLCDKIWYTQAEYSKHLSKQR